MNEPIITNIPEKTEIQYRPFRFLDIIFALLVFAWSQVNALTLMLLPNAKDTTKIIIWMIILAGNTCLIYGAIRTIMKSIKTHEDTAPTLSAKAIIKIAGITVLMLMATIFFNSFLPINETINQNALDDFMKQVPILAALHIIIVAPICEDMCFRYFLVRPGKLWWFRFIVSWVLFIAIHVTPGESIIVSLAYLVPASFLHGTRLAFNSVRYSLTLHMFYNAIIVGTMFMVLNS